MSVREMGDLLGLKKTDRYWLLHKNLFETVVVGRKTFVNVASFEKWYANQVKYHKVNGEEPGRELKKHSLSARDIAEMLGLSEAHAYDLIKEKKLPTILVDGWKRVPRQAFEDWYAGQTRYRTEADRERDAAAEAASISMPEMAGLLGVSRSEIYALLDTSRYRDVFEIIIIADRRRITKKSFWKFLQVQDQYHLAEEREEATADEAEQLPGAEQASGTEKSSGAQQSSGVKSSRGRKYLTRAEAATRAGVARSTIGEWAKDGYFPEVQVGGLLRIPEKEFMAWLRRRAQEG